MPFFAVLPSDTPICSSAALCDECAVDAEDMDDLSDDAVGFDDVDDGADDGADDVADDDAEDGADDGADDDADDGAVGSVEISLAAEQAAKTKAANVHAPRDSA